MFQACSEIPGYERGMSPNASNRDASAMNDAPSVMIRLASAVVRRLKPKARTASRLPATAARKTATAPASQSGNHSFNWKVSSAPSTAKMPCAKLTMPVVR